MPAELLRNWKGYSPKTRNAVLDVLLRRDDWLKTTLDALEKKEIAPSEVDAPRRQRLLEHRDDGVRNRVTKLFAGLINADRQKVIDSYAEVLKLQGDAAKGLASSPRTAPPATSSATSATSSAPTWHRSADKSSQGMLIAVLDPNRAVEARYVNYSAITRAGLTLTGILASETGNSITLIGQDGKPQVILRKDLDELTSTGKSLMPEGLEKEIKPQDMADIFAFVRSAGPQVKPKVFKGNKPELVKANDGSLLLSREERGSLRPRTWSSRTNTRTWATGTRTTAWRSGRWTCRRRAATRSCCTGPAQRTRPASHSSCRPVANQLTSKVTATGGWDIYKEAEVGSLVLSAGQQRLSMRPAGRLNGTAMLDLKSIKLVPVKE